MGVSKPSTHRGGKYRQALIGATLGLLLSVLVGGGFALMAVSDPGGWSPIRVFGVILGGGIVVAVPLGVLISMTEEF